MLNNYQIRFLRRLSEDEVPFLIVGGQAKHHFDGRWDLDIWCHVEAEGETSAVLYQLIRKWRDEHPNHLLSTSFDTSVGNRILIPDDSNVGYMHDGKMMSVSLTSGIDLLCGSRDLLFPEYHARAEPREAEPGFIIPCLSRADVAALPRLARYTGDQ